MEALLILLLLALLLSGAIALLMVIGARQRLREVEDRLRSLESRAFASRMAERAAPPSPPMPSAPPSPKSPPVAPVVPVAPSRAPEPWLEVLQGPRRDRRKEPQAPSIAPWTTWVAGHWLLIAGALVLQLGIAFGVKYSFEQGWIDEPVRVAGGCAIGLAFCILSFRPRVARIRPLSEALLAAGLASLYFSGFAAHHYYGLVPLEAALGFVALVSAVSGIVAAVRNLALTGHLALVGAYLAPLLFATGVDRQPALFLYLFVISCGALVLAARRAWPAIPWIAALATTVIARLWFDRFFRPELLARSLLLHGVVVAPLVAMPFVRARRRQVTGADLGAAALVAGLAALAAIAHCQPGEPGVRWVIAGDLHALLAGIYGGLALALRRFWPEQRALRRLHSAVALVLVPAAVAGWFDGNPVTLVFCAQCVWLAAIAARHAAPLDRIGALVIGLLAAVRILGGIPRLGIEVPFQEQVVTLAAAIGGVALLYVAMRLLRSPRPAVEQDADPLEFATTEIAVAGARCGEFLNAAALMATWFRFMAASRREFALGPEVFCGANALALGLLGLVLVEWGLRSALRFRIAAGGLLVLGALGGLVILVGTVRMEGAVARAPVFNAPLVLAAVALGGVAIARARLERAVSPQRELRVALGAGLLLLPLLLLGAEFLRLVRKYDWSDQRGLAGTSILIGAYATGLLAVAASRRSKAVRSVALALYGILLVKMFVFDLAGLETIWRVVAFVVVGALLLLAWLLLRDRAKDTVAPPTD